MCRTRWTNEKPNSSISQELHDTVNREQSSEKTSEVEASVDPEVEHSNEVAVNDRHDGGGCAEEDGVDGSATPSVVVETAYRDLGNPNNKLACSDALTIAVITGINVQQSVREVEDEIITPGFIANANGPEVDRSQINVEVSLGTAQMSRPLHTGPLYQLYRSPQGSNEVDNHDTISTSAQIHDRVIVKSGAGVERMKDRLMSPNLQNIVRRTRKRKKMSKTEINVIRRLARGAKISKIRGSMPVGSWHREILFRAALNAVSSSLSDRHDNDREKQLVFEAQETIGVGRILGLNCNGMEQEAIQRCMEFEQKDVDRVAIRRCFVMVCLLDCPVVVYSVDGKKLIHKEITNRGCCYCMELLMVLGKMMLVWVSSDSDEDGGVVVGATSRSYLLIVELFGLLVVCCFVVAVWSEVGKWWMAAVFRLIQDPKSISCDSSPTNYTPNSRFGNNLKILLESLSSNTPLNQGFNSIAIGNNTDQVYGQALCRGDVTHKVCRDCIKNAS
ncbi:Cysteine-rich receptor-like protein kinase 10 [Camellia lanceoleosa]|uniref:Cysteine-rich receptor-like protein kinase 10 n=1 Tax=Camellia lanceoleosa TaxID=1840588 RepID=A0ACC0I6P7_9ERIC|nr:Cysteine-rich receptor-like protein kinase 10 [Camellia lanceoleosa]